MKTADLYIRVSTDEQADKGYSQRSQEELLTRYCEINHIIIRKIIREDHSAKTFSRPAWLRYMQDLRNRKQQSDFLLFLKWDRFSRNAGDAYEMIKTLRMFGVEPQAIEQPLDLSIPENKMMLAFYLAAPEVENDRRALNVIHGMRRASKEGRYMCTAPFGYINRTRADGRKYIAIDEPAAEIVRWMYLKTAEGVYNGEQLFKLAQQKGFDRVKSTFYQILRNPTYYGKIVVKSYKDEARHVVNGLHEPIITESMFFDVQDVLKGKKKGPNKAKIFSDARFPLRGFLKCPRCGRVLTGSSSKGRGRYYSYYHCSKPCYARAQTTVVEDRFLTELKKYAANPEMSEIYMMFINDAWSNQTNHIKSDRKELINEMQTIEDKLSRIRGLLSSGELDASDYRKMKSEHTAELERLESKLAKTEDDRIALEPLLKKGLNTLFNIVSVYERSDIARKRELIGSMFPEKMTFDGNTFRTGRINEAAELIFMINSKLRAQKNRTKKEKILLSGWEPPAGIEPATY